MKKKKKSKLSHINDLDNIFSEIDVKADTINNTNNDNIKLYSLDVLSDISDNSSNNSIDLNDYDLEMGKEIQRMISREKNNQFNQFSIIYFNKIKQNININEL